MALGVLPAAAALLAACAAPVQAAERENSPGNWLYLTVTRDGDRSVHARGTLLLCDPPQGHTRADKACAELDAAGGDIHALPLLDAACPMIYAPVTAQAHGEWNGRQVTYTETFANGCEMAARTGAVFAMDD